MAEKEVVLTLEGIKKMEQELDFLRSVKRREVAERIKQAREYGDISENSEYEDAKNEQSFVEGRILTLEKTLRNAKVLDEAEHHDVVSLGSVVKLKDLESNEEVEYSIVGTLEADPKVSRISNESPVGRAIMGQRVGAVVDVETPGGTVKYAVLAILR